MGLPPGQHSVGGLDLLSKNGSPRQGEIPVTSRNFRTVELFSHKGWTAVLPGALSGASFFPKQVYASYGTSARRNPAGLLPLAAFPFDLRA